MKWKTSAKKINRKIGQMAWPLFRQRFILLHFFRKMYLMDTPRTRIYSNTSFFFLLIFSTLKLYAVSQAKKTSKPSLCLVHQRHNSFHLWFSQNMFTGMLSTVLSLVTIAYLNQPWLQISDQPKKLLLEGLLLRLITIN